MTAGNTPTTEPDLSRATAWSLLGVIALVALGLGLTALRHGLPAVFHSDFIQVQQGADLATHGAVEDQTIYPITLVFFYATADLVAFAAGHVLGWEHYASWPQFTEHLSQPIAQHAIGRSLNAVFAALLGVAAYRLARLRFDRRTAVLAAAIAAFCPLQTIYTHQVRPHIPVITIAALLGPMVLRAVGRPTLRAGLRAGAAAGLVNSVFQVGLALGAAACGLIVLLTRPWRSIPRVLLGAAAGFAGAWLGVRELIRHCGLVTPGIGTTMLERAPEQGLGYGLTTNWFADLGRIPLLGLEWVATEPLRAVATAGFLLLCVLGRRSWRDAILYGAFPLASIAVIALVMGARPRYSMYSTPFLAPLAASACLAIPGAVARRLCAALLVLAPLVSSVRCDLLLLRQDTRLQLGETLPGLTAAGLAVSIHADLVPTGGVLPTGAELFPPRGNFKPWYRKEETPRQTFGKVGPDVYVRERRDYSDTRMPPRVLERSGYALVGRIGGDVDFIPDEPRFVLPEAWGADRPGPGIDLWARKADAATARAALPAHVRVK